MTKSNTDHVVFDATDSEVRCRHCEDRSALADGATAELFVMRVRGFIMMHKLTAVSVEGAGERWSARVAGVTAEGSTRLEALQEAWAGAEFEEQIGALAPTEACRV